MEKYIEALKGISYFEWIKLREGMDNEFNRLIGESKRKLELTDVERVEKLSVHNLDKHRVDSPIIPFVINVNIIKTIKTMFKFFILIAWRIDGSTLFPPEIR